MQEVRDGLAQGRNNLQGTKNRLLESEKRLDGKVGEFIAKEYWCALRPTPLLPSLVSWTLGTL